MAHGVLLIKIIFFEGLIRRGNNTYGPWTHDWQTNTQTSRIYTDVLIKSREKVRGWALDTAHNSSWPLHRLSVLCGWPCDLDLWPNIHWWMRYRAGLSFAKFSDPNLLILPYDTIHLLSLTTCNVGYVNIKKIKIFTHADSVCLSVSLFVRSKTQNKWSQNVQTYSIWNDLGMP